MSESTVDGTCMWLYGVTANDSILPVSDPPDHDAGATSGQDAVSGVANEQVRAIREAGLAALAGPVPLSEFGQPAIRENLERLDWLSEVARAHDAVVRSAMAATAVVPVRLVTLFSDEAEIRSLLRTGRTEFEAALSRLTGRTEWGVKAFGVAEPDADAELAVGSPTASGSGPGTSYLLRRQAARTERQRKLRAAAECGDRLHARLAALSVAARRHKARDAEHGSGPLVLNGAYLVEDQRFEVFRDAVAAEDGHDAVRVELTGPWPAYSFASVPGLTGDA